MKTGDLVRWNHPTALDYGLVVEIGGNCFAGEAYIRWVDQPEHSGYYPIEHELLEVINESR